MKRLILSVLIFGSYAAANGQQHYPIFTQNYANPYLVNPSFITLERRAEVNATFRQQWTGITDGPKTMQLDFQYPIDRKLSLGLNLYNDKSILLSSSGVLATFGYKVRLTTAHILGFALSGGFVSNQIDLDDVPDIDLIDPVLLNSSNNFDFDGQFGMHYQYKNFLFGLSLLKLVDNRPFSEGSVQQEKFDPFKDRTAFMSYRIYLSEQLSLNPSIYYRSTFTGYEYFEGALLFNYRNFITIGGGYRSELGPHAVIRIRFKNLHAGYAYDFPATRYGGSTGGTNEVQLKFQFGRVTEPLESLATEDSIPPAREEEAIAENEERQKEKSEEPAAPVRRVEPVVTVDEKPKTETETPSPVIEQTETIVERKSDISEAELTGNATYQLVVGVFSRSAHAERYVRQLNNDGVKAKVLTSNETDYYYVIVPEYATKAITLDRVLDIRNNTQFKDAWFKHFN